MTLVELKELRALKLADGITARVVHTGNLSVAHVRCTAGAAATKHAHHHEQITCVIEGELELTVDGEATILTPGRTMIVPPMVAHSAVAKSACYVIDVFHPVREDLRAMAESPAGTRA